MQPQELSHMNYRLVRLLAGSALLFCAACANAQTPDADSAVPLFDIASYEVSGDTLLGPQLVQSLVAPFAGRQRDVRAIEPAVEALDNSYRGRGFTRVVVA